MPSPTVTARPSAGGGERGRPVEDEIELHDARDDPDRRRASPRATPNAAVASSQKRVFDQEHRGQPAAGRAQDFQDRRIGEPGAPIGRERARRAPGPRSSARRRSRRGWRARAWRPKLRRFPCASRTRTLATIGNSLRHGAHELELGFRRGGRQRCGDQFSIGRAFERVGRIDQHEIDREALPVHLAQVRESSRRCRARAR